jgi:sortase A
MIATEIKYKFKKEELSQKAQEEIDRDTEKEIELEKLAEADRVIRIQEEAKSYGVDSYFSIVVPKIDARSKIIPNVDTSNAKEYKDALMKGIAHAKGTYFPGEQQKIFLFAHSTDTVLNVERYNAVFYLLGKLEKGDRIIIYFADDKYIYEVDEVYKTDKSDTSIMMQETEGEVLMLMTCDPPGTTWRRLIVKARIITN